MSTDTPPVNSIDGAVGRESDPETAGDGSVIAILKRQRTLLGTIAGSVAVLGSLTFIGTRLATDTVAATATAAAPTYTEGGNVKLSTDLSGALRTTSGGGGGNPAGGWLDSIRRVGRMDSLTLLRSVDSSRKLTVLDSARKVTTLDSARKVGVADSVRSIGRVLADSALIARWFGSTAPTVGSKTSANSIPVVVASDQTAVATTGGAADSVQLRTGQKHAGRVAVDSIIANQTHIGRVAVDSSLAVGTFTPLCVTGTAAVNTGVTVTLPAVAGQFHYVTLIQVTKLYNVVGVAAGAGVIITTTNLPGPPAFTTEQLASAAGTAVTVVNVQPGWPIRSSVVNTATTIVAPAQLQTIWRTNVCYYTAP